MNFGNLLRFGVYAGVAYGAYYLAKRGGIVPSGYHLPLPPGSWHVSSGFQKGRVSPVDGVTRDHQGIDLAAPTGTPIYACEGGRVQAVSSSSSNGLYVSVRGKTYTWYYLHMSKQAPLTVGQTVVAGDQLGEVGMTGRATGPHLHLQVQTGGNDTAVDPLTLMPELAA